MEHNPFFNLQGKQSVNPFGFTSRVNPLSDKEAGFFFTLPAILCPEKNRGTVVCAPATGSKQKKLYSAISRQYVSSRGMITELPLP